MAVHEEVCEAGAEGRGAVEVAEGEFVGGAVGGGWWCCGGGEVLRVVLAAKARVIISWGGCWLEVRLFVCLYVCLWFGWLCLFGRNTYGAVMGTIWDPSPEIQYDVLPVALSFESTRLPGWSGVESVRLEAGVEAASDSVDPSKSRQYNTISDNMPEYAILLDFLFE